MVVVVIPAYEPDEKLIKLISSLKEQCDYNILIVDDGSGEKYSHIFEKSASLGANIISYSENKGKGGALKTAFSYLKKQNNIDAIVTADCDGQHLPKDILKVVDSINHNRNEIILGARHFAGKVPFRSMLGNRLTSSVFQLIYNTKISDTQTGLRGFSYSMLDWLCSIHGNGYEYEMNMLIDSKKNGYEIKEVSIETVYLENNKSSHFNPLRDSLKIYLPILKFSFSSIISATLDFILLLLIKVITSNLLMAVTFSRLFSASINYIINRNYVFSSAININNKISLPKYILLALCIMIFNYIILSYLYNLGINLILSKILTEGFLFIFSFMIQKKFIFQCN